MAANSFGKFFKCVTWGESHGKAIGVVIDGCPPLVPLSEEDINQEMQWRQPGTGEWTSGRKEADQVEILSGVFEGKTTGSPISLLIWNQDVQSKRYETQQHLLKPGHAQYTYMQKYGCFDYRGSGRASARETACRVAAGAVAKKILSDAGVSVIAFLKSIGSTECNLTLSDLGEGAHFKEMVRSSPLFCPDLIACEAMRQTLAAVKKEEDSIGGVVEAIALHVPVGWGDPVYEKLEANLAKAMLSLPASKGFEIGCGFSSAAMRGSEHNDLFSQQGGQVHLLSNHAGGTLGGISNGMPILIRVPFKPASHIGKAQPTIDKNGNEKLLTSEAGRHDPCVAIRAVPVVEAMFALVLVDAMLAQKLIKN